ncbi:MAG: STAS/SEC14 domain-containing protein [Candidatus Pacebacteria bacterium]|nr:STAS/SEC14 domain-containing protein [Candidatus Paceibacterota bacterium]
MSPHNTIIDLTVTPEGMLYTRLTGSVTSENIDELRKEVATAKLVVYGEYQKRNAKFKSLIDITGFSGTYVPEALSILSELMRANKSYIEKSALYGVGDALTAAANIVTSFSGRDNLSFFQTKEEAVAWLNAE